MGVMSRGAILPILWVIAKDGPKGRGREAGP